MHRVDIIGADLIALYPERFAVAASAESGRTMPTCPLCGTGDCVSHPVEDEPMAVKSNQTENKSLKATEDKVAAPAAAPAPAAASDAFTGAYDVLEDGRVRFNREVTLDVPTAGGARTSVLLASAGMVTSAAWVADKRAYYEM